MADRGYISQQLAPFPSAQKTSLDTIFTYLLANLRWGLPGHQQRAENAQLYQLDATTPAVANQEFSIAHGLTSAPRLVVPVLDVTQTGNQFTSLTVARPADSKRIYLKASSTSAPITLYVESR